MKIENALIRFQEIANQKNDIRKYREKYEQKETQKHLTKFDRVLLIAQEKRLLNKIYNVPSL